MNSSPTEDGKPSEIRRVLDASALLALILKENGGARVDEALAEGAAICSVNLAEVITRLVDYGLTAVEIGATLEGLQYQVIDFEDSHAWAAGFLREPTRALGLSLGDRSCLALAQTLGVPALTADRAWAQLKVGVAIEICR